MNRNQRFESMMDRVADTIGWTAAHKAKVETRHIPQHTKGDICPMCNGEGEVFIGGINIYAKCSGCRGSGKRSPVR